MANEDPDPTGREDEEPVAPPETDDSFVPDFLKRTILSGVRTLSWGSEKVGAVGSTLNSVRQEVVDVAGRQIVKYLEQLNLTEEAVKILTSISLEVRTEIRFIPNDQQLVSPRIKGSVTVKAADGSTKTKTRTSRRSRKKAKKQADPAE